MLEQVLRMYEIEDRVIGEIYTSGLEMYMGIGGPSGPSAPGAFGGTLGRSDFDLRPMKLTETLSINLDDISPGLRIVEKYHPDGTYKTVFGQKGREIETDSLNNLLNSIKLYKPI